MIKLQSYENGYYLLEIKDNGITFNKSFKDSDKTVEQVKQSNVLKDGLCVDMEFQKCS